MDSIIGVCYPNLLDVFNVRWNRSNVNRIIPLSARGCREGIQGNLGIVRNGD